MFTKENIKLAHKVIQEITLPVLDEIYDTLNIGFKPEDYDPESWYGGAPHPITGKVLDKKYQIEGMLTDLFTGIEKAGPLSVDASGKVVWSKGNGVPSYKYDHNGTMFFTSFPYVKYDKKEEKYVKATPGYPEYGIKCEFFSDGTKGLGVTYKAACSLWGKDVVDSLPIEQPEKKECVICYEPEMAMA